MPSGGARVRSGPGADPNALRRDRKNDADWVTLPAAGTAGDPPAWPLTDPNERELERWAQLWATPQAAQWEKLGFDVEVALYVRRLGEAELREAPVSLNTLVRQMRDSLGLTAPGMRSLRWKIAQADDKSAKAEPAKTPAVEQAPASKARERFRVINGSAAG